MATSVIYGVTADARVECGNAAYANAREGTGTLAAGADTAVTFLTNQEITGGSVYYCYESFIGFDLTAFWAANPGAVISAATLTLYTDAIASSSKRIDARLQDWGATVTTADFVAGSALSAKPLLAHASPTATGDIVFTDDAMVANVPTSGVMRMLLAGNDQMSNIAPTVNETIGFRSADAVTQAERPRLTLTYTIPSSSNAAGLLAMIF